MLYGRDTELTAIDAVLASARERRGRAVFFVGEAGIGKSSLLAECRVRATGTVLEGAAWESPGAPPYWPWIQVMRAAEARFGAKVRADAGIKRLLGESVIDDTADPAAARFALLDGVVRALVALAEQEPLVIVLDDLHAADMPTLELLDLACRDVARCAIAIVGAWREAELAARPDAAKRLARVCRHGVTLPLRRLSAAEVTTWVGERGAALHAASEGNPLFVEELLRAHAAACAPRGITAVLDDHLALVSADTRALLASASVLGRELDPRLVEVICERDRDAVERAFREATAAGLGDPRDDRWVFRHVLLREQLYASLGASERAARHRAAGEALARAAASADAAHHLLAGVAGGDHAHAVTVARAAAARAMTMYAFEDAAALLAAAARVLEPSGELATRIDVDLELARARHGAGMIETGRAVALRAGELARTAGDAERFARATLDYATELTSGRSDPVMVEQLEAALAMLPPGDGSLQARLIARLAAALVPPVRDDDERPFELADAALAMAERIGDDHAKLYALRYNGHAHGFRRGLVDTMPRVLDMIALADRLGRPLEALEHRSWLVNAYLGLGDLRAADETAAPLFAMLERLPQPHYRWRVPIALAQRATMRGEFAAADRYLATVRQIAREHEVDRARMCANFGAISVALVSRSPERARATLDDTRGFKAMIGGPTSAAILASMLAVAGEREEARRELASIRGVPFIGLVQFALEAALIVDDRDRIALTIGPLTRAAQLAPLAYGPALSLVMCPIDVAIGEGLVRLGRASEAIAPLERGLALCRRLEAPPFIARAAAALAELVPARAAQLRDEARRHAAVEAAPFEAPVQRSVGNMLAIARDGDGVRVRWRERELRVATGKGLDYLAALLARPSGELHVSELVGDEDRGDAGEMLDATARAAYKERIDELREELASAEARNDLGHVDRLSAELEMVTEQITSATGLGGRSRRAGARVERARVNVQRRIRDAIQRLAAEDATLGRYLEATVRTGTFCSFTPIDE